jgi:hypothetical protein
VIERLDVELACSFIERNPETFFRMFGELHVTEQDFIEARRFAALPSQAEFRPPRSNEEIICERRIDATSEDWVARTTHSVSSEASTCGVRKDVFLAR